jgi:hypothetical protein
MFEAPGAGRDPAHGARRFVAPVVYAAFRLVALR